MKHHSRREEAPTPVRQVRLQIHRWVEVVLDHELIGVPGGEKAGLIGALPHLGHEPVQKRASRGVQAEDLVEHDRPKVGQRLALVAPVCIGPADLHALALVSEPLP